MGKKTAAFQDVAELEKLGWWGESPAGPLFTVAGVDVCVFLASGKHTKSY
jgi:hypothetical protein